MRVIIFITSMFWVATLDAQPVSSLLRTLAVQGPAAARFAQQWPQPESFYQRGRTAPRPMRVVHGIEMADAVRDADGEWIAEPPTGGWSYRAATWAVVRDAADALTVMAGEAAGQDLSQQGVDDDGRIVFRGYGKWARVRPLTSVSLPKTSRYTDAWAYVRTLAGGTPYTPVADTVDAEAFDRAWIASGIESGEVADAAIQTLIDTMARPSDRRLGRLATHLESLGRSADAISVMRRYQPVGSCSMDTSPGSNAVRFADMCHRAGDLRCFLQLYVRIIGDRFPRVAWSSMGDQITATHAERLSVTGVDAHRFLQGLLSSYDGDDDSWVRADRVGRAMAESGDANGHRRFLHHAVGDPSLDPFNRWRATAALVGLELYDGRERPFSAVGPEILALRLHPLASAWLEGQLED